MTAPRLETEPMMTVQIALRRVPVGTTPWGERRETFFEGTATSPLWEGNRRVEGIDHITQGTNGIARLDVHAFISDPDGDEVVTYRGHGRASPTGPFEGVTFETSCERLAWLNEAVAIGVMSRTGDELVVHLYRVVA
ncbi:MAG: DUF3237 family protein [Thermoanaerobaculia bacterium]